VAIDPDDPDDPHGLEHEEFLRKPEAGKTVTREERDLDLLPSILPSAYPCDEREERLDPSASELLLDKLFMAGASPNRIPMSFIRHHGPKRHSSALSLTGHHSLVDEL
jgi:hypothetical protein